jgi:hypothetical protein
MASFQALSTQLHCQLHGENAMTVLDVDVLPVSQVICIKLFRSLHPPLAWSLVVSVVPPAGSPAAPEGSLWIQR